MFDNLTKYTLMELKLSALYRFCARRRARKTSFVKINYVCFPAYLLFIAHILVTHLVRHADKQQTNNPIQVFLFAFMMSKETVLSLMFATILCCVEQVQNAWPCHSATRT